jgi:hypothetical protein
MFRRLVIVKTDLYKLVLAKPALTGLADEKPSHQGREIPDATVVGRQTRSSVRRIRLAFLRRPPDQATFDMTSREVVFATLEMP